MPSRVRGLMRERMRSRARRPPRPARKPSAGQGHPRRNASPLWAFSRWIFPRQAPVRRGPIPRASVRRNASGASEGPARSPAPARRESPRPRSPPRARAFPLHRLFLLLLGAAIPTTKGMGQGEAGPGNKFHRMFGLRTPAVAPSPTTSETLSVRWTHSWRVQVGLLQCIHGLRPGDSSLLKAPPTSAQHWDSVALSLGGSSAGTIRAGPWRPPWRCRARVPEHYQGFTFSSPDSRNSEPSPRTAPGRVMRVRQRNGSASFALVGKLTDFGVVQMHGDILRYFITFPPVWRPGQPCRPLNSSVPSTFPLPCPRAMKRQRSGNGAPMMPASPLIGAPGQKGCRAPGHSLRAGSRSAPYPMYGMDNSIYENKWQQKKMP